MTAERDVINHCMCHKVRVAARSVTSAYDQALRPVGLRATQFAVLAAVGIDGSMSITALAQILGMDRTTLSRNLGPLERAGLITVGLEGWRRSRTLQITKKGRARIRDAMPLWKRAQDGLKQRLGEQKWNGVSNGLASLIQTG